MLNGKFSFFCCCCLMQCARMMVVLTGGAFAIQLHTTECKRRQQRRTRRTYSEREREREQQQQKTTMMWCEWCMVRHKSNTREWELEIEKEKGSTRPEKGRARDACGPCRVVWGDDTGFLRPAVKCAAENTKWFGIVFRRVNRMCCCAVCTLCCLYRMKRNDIKCLVLAGSFCIRTFDFLLLVQGHFWARPLRHHIFVSILTCNGLFHRQSIWWLSRQYKNDGKLAAT